MKIKRTLPPSGAPLYIKDLIFGVFGMVRPAKALEKFENQLRSYFCVKHVFLVSSGKAALTLILQSLSEITGRNEVVIPSYTCFSVPSAVIKAGLKPVICDISENDINYDFEHLEQVVSDRTLCVLATHLFGIPCDLEPIQSVARSTRSYIVEDCAQAMGVKLYGKKVGTIGDVGFFSLGRGKNLSAASGGIIITNEDAVAEILRRKYIDLETPGLISQLRSFCVSLLLYIFSRPSLYWLPAGLSFLKIGQTIYSTDFFMGKLSGFNAGLASDWKAKLKTFNRDRRRKAATYRVSLKDKGFGFVKEQKESCPVYLRFPLIMENSTARDKALEELSSATSAPALTILRV